jgi:hypothetical protein
MDFREMLNFLEFRISGYDTCLFPDGRGKGKGIGIGYGILCLDFSGFKDKIIGTWYDPDRQKPYVIQQILRGLYPHNSCAAIVYFTQIYNIKRDFILVFTGTVKEILNELGAVFILNPGQNRVGVQKIFFFHVFALLSAL